MALLATSGQVGGGKNYTQFPLASSQVCHLTCLSVLEQGVEKTPSLVVRKTQAPELRLAHPWHSVEPSVWTGLALEVRIDST